MVQVRDLKQRFNTLLDPKALNPEERLVHARMLFQGQPPAGFGFETPASAGLSAGER
jgi:hypothetical protein